jgi:hypothetical protein
MGISWAVAVRRLAGKSKKKCTGHRMKDKSNAVRDFVKQLSWYRYLRNQSRIGNNTTKFMNTGTALKRKKFHLFDC